MVDCRARERKERRLSSVLLDSFTMRQASPQIVALLLLIFTGPRFDVAAEEPAQGTPPKKLDQLVLSEDLAQAPKEIIRDGSVSQAHRGWKFLSGKWEFVDGAMRGAMLPADMRGAQAVCVLPFQDAVFEFEVRFNGARMVQFRIQDEKPEHICRVSITRDGFSAQKDDHDHEGPDTATPFGSAALKIRDGEWKSVSVEIHGEQMSATIDGQRITGTHSLIAAPKHFFEFIVTGDGASFRNLRVWEGKGAASKPEK